MSPDVLGLPDQGLAPEFAPYPAAAGKMGGWAYTIRGRMTRYSGNGDPPKMRAVDGVGRGDLAVWSGGGASPINTPDYYSRRCQIAGFRRP
ncbi:MAG TPA: hypothetical protein VEM38_08120 [Burkholderiales bacterium]|nr:hypothetical protein [Burkholderiales bacterium]